MPRKPPRRLSVQLRNLTIKHAGVITVYSFHRELDTAAALERGDAMSVDVGDRRDTRAPVGTIGRVAWMLILIVDVGYIAWGAGAAVSPDHLLGPGGKAILPAGYEGYSGGSWSALTGTSPQIAGFMTLLYRMYGMYNVLFGVLSSAIAVTAFRRGEPWAWWTLLLGNTVALVAAMTYDKIVNAIGPFEVTEYLGLALVWIALAATAPMRAGERTARVPA